MSNAMKKTGFPTDFPESFIDVGEPEAVQVRPPVEREIRPAQAYENLPYGFAKRHGVLLELNSDSELKLVHRSGVTTMALAEARRKAGQSFITEQVDEDEFDARLTTQYEGDTGQAVDIMDDFGDELNLEQLADA